MAKLQKNKFCKCTILYLTVVMLMAAGCGKTSPSPSQPSSSVITSGAGETSSVDSSQTEAARPLGSLRVGFNFTVQDRYSTNQVAVWIEDENGNYVDTVYVTRFTAAGGHIKRPNSLPYWLERTKWDSSEIERVHAVTQATPSQSGPLAVVWDCTDEKGQPVPAGNYVYLVETNIDGDNRIVWRGSFTVGGQDMQAPATAEYLPETAAELESQSPVNGVEAIYTPAA